MFTSKRKYRRTGVPTRQCLPLLPACDRLSTITACGRRPPPEGHNVAAGYRPDAAIAVDTAAAQPGPGTRLVNTAGASGPVGIVVDRPQRVERDELAVAAQGYGPGETAAVAKPVGSPYPFGSRTLWAQDPARGHDRRAGGRLHRTPPPPAPPRAPPGGKTGPACRRRWTLPWPSGSAP